MSGALPNVARREAVRRRLAARRGVAFGLAVLVVWFGGSVLLGALASEGDVCTSCHTMQPYAEKAKESEHSTLECPACHGATGATALLQDGLALQRHYVRHMVGAVPHATDIDDTPCLTCHARVRSGVAVSRGIRVQHLDFIKQRCAGCHGGAGHLMEARQYAVPEMDSCLGCHQVAADSLAACAMCHSVESQRRRRETDSSWRVTHGPTWKSTHGMGDLRTCSACHDAAYCVKCHLTPIPHIADWQILHGAGLPDNERKACASCHEPRWCSSCHGVEMPHPEGFLPTHGVAASKTGESACSRCHVAAECVDCHLRSAHPDLPGVGMDTGGI